MPDKFPAFQFYPGDWRKDAAVQSMSREAKADWLEIICMMHDSPERGVLLLPNGRPMSDAELGRNLGLTPAQTKKTLTTILESGTGFRREDGALYNKRMVKDEALRKVRTAAGSLGGNPNLVKQKTTIEDKHDDNQTTTPSSSSSVFSLQEEGKEASPLVPEPVSRVTPELLIRAYNENRGVLPEASVLSSGRRKKCLTRISKAPDSWEYLSTFGRGVVRAANSQFCTGGGGRGWRADFDFMIENDENLIRILEGKYDGPSTGTSPNSGIDRKGPALVPRAYSPRQ